MNACGRKTEAAADRRGYMLVADDYGMAPGVGDGIRALLSSGRLSGTGCMTLFAEWPAQAGLLLSTPGVEAASIGLHLTLTDFPSLTGRLPLSGLDRLPPLRKLIVASYRGGIDEAAVHAELDAQLAAFVAATGRLPDYFDGHQHVHFLPVVRRWLAARLPQFAASGAVPWLRGAPAVGLAETFAVRAKVSVVWILALGFNRAMRDAGYRVYGPLAGFYDWRQPDSFAGYLAYLDRHKRAGMVVMCHPGRIDALLKARDGFIDAREVELAVLSQPDAGEAADGRGSVR